MGNIKNHSSATTTKLLFIGDSGCLAPDTIVSAKRGDKPKKLDLQTVFNRTNGNHHNRSSNDTYLLADMGGYAGLSKMHGIVSSGKKQLFQITAASGAAIKASADHLFQTSEGWAAVSDLRQNTPLAAWRSARNKLARRRGNGRHNPISRPYVYSIPYHPFAQANWVAGRNYKRDARARIIVEATMNGISLAEFIAILRNEPTVAATLQYLPRDVDVHHLDGNFENDALDNLHVLDRAEHIQEHQENKVQASKEITYDHIISIEEVKEDETYDIMMEAPHNFIANGFVVHNSGKTGALASLAGAGYNLRILDFDNGLDVLKNLLLDPKSPYPSGSADRVEYITLTEKMKNVGGKPIPVKADVWQRAMNMLYHWKEVDGDKVVSDLGQITTWTGKDILVIDSLSGCSQAAMNFILSLNGRLGQQPYQSDWGLAQQLVEPMLQMLYSDSIKCNVVVNCHITYIGEDGGPQRGYPNTLGKALPPKVGRYFNSMLLAKSTGQGNSLKRKILTNVTGVLDLKNTAPLRVANEYPLETGLADYFKAVRS